uniref:ZAD domain-containing protein n=1 Tax=Schizaphis graminum TaxID=13262 RepID=A0A2S2P2R9_SCHGA
MISMCISRPSTIVNRHSLPTVRSTYHIDCCHPTRVCFSISLVILYCLKKNTMIKMHLHRKNFDFCRICLLEPKSNTHLTFVHILTSAIRDLPLKQHLKDLLGIEISSNDSKPKKICEKCFIKVADLYEMKRNAAESEKAINYIISKKFKTANKKSFNNTNLKSTLTDETKLLPVKKNITNNLFYICILIVFFVFCFVYLNIFHFI